MWIFRYWNYKILGPGIHQWNRLPAQPMDHTCILDSNIQIITDVHQAWGLSNSVVESGYSVVILRYFIIFRPIRRAGSPLVRTPSPRRRNHLHPHHDIGFSDTVSNVVEIVKEERGHRGYRQNIHSRYPRGMHPKYVPCCRNIQSQICSGNYKYIYICCWCFVVWGHYGLMLFHFTRRIHVITIAVTITVSRKTVDLPRVHCTECGGVKAWIVQNALYAVK